MQLRLDGRTDRARSRDADRAACYVPAAQGGGLVRLDNLVQIERAHDAPRASTASTASAR